MPTARRAAARSPGANRSRSTPGGTTRVRDGVGAVEADQLAGLLVGVGDQPVGLGDDLLLADDAGAGLGPVAVGQRLVLDLGQGVRGVDERHAPPVAGEPADLAGEPVVRVDDVVVARLVLGLLAQDGGGEGAQLGGELLLAEALERAGADVADRHARAHLDDRREVAGGGAGEDVDLDAAGGEAAGGLDDVDVHAAGVAGAGLVERAGVHRERRHPPGRAGAGKRRAGTCTPPARWSADAGARPAPVDCSSCNSVRMWFMPGTEPSHSPPPPAARRRPHRRRHRRLERDRGGDGAAAGGRGLRRRRRGAPDGPAGRARGVDRGAGAAAGRDRSRRRSTRSPPRWTGSTCW